MKRIIFTKLAERELEYAMRFYEVESTGLLHKFPYKLLYALEHDHIVVIAVAHQHRKPDYWADNSET